MTETLDAAVGERADAVRGEEGVELRVLAAGEVDRELGELLAVAAEDFDEQRGRLAGAFDDAEVGAVAVGLRDLLEREDGRRGAVGALPMKFANGMAGMYWPKVPFAVTLNVREEAKRDEVGEAGERRRSRSRSRSAVSGRISSVPMALSPPVPNQLAQDVVERDGAARLDGERGLASVRDAVAAAGREGELVLDQLRRRCWSRARRTGTAS